MSRPSIVWTLALGLSCFFVGSGSAMAGDSGSQAASPRSSDAGALSSCSSGSLSTDCASACEASPDASGSALKEQAPPASALESSASSEMTKAHAKDLVMRATDAVLAEQWQEAERLFRGAWAIEKTYDIAGNLGNLELMNGKPLDAAVHLRFSLEALPPSETAELRKRVLDRFNEARRQIGGIAIDVSIAGAAISVDGQVVGASPLAAEVLVAPGSHTVRASLSGYEQDEQRVDVQRGGSSALKLLLSPSLPALAPSVLALSPPLLAPSSTGRPLAPPDAPSSSAARIGILIAGGTLSAAGFAVGGGLYASSMTTKESVTLLRARLDRKNGPEACYDEPTLKEDCSKLATATNSEAAMSIGSKVAFGVGGAALAGSALYFFLSRSSRPARSATTVLPSVTANAGGLLVTSVW